MFYTYILFSKQRSRYYSGSTQNIKERIHYHNATLRGYTSVGQPWSLVYIKILSTRSKAEKLENRIKKRGAERFLIGRITTWISAS